MHAKEQRLVIFHNYDFNGVILFSKSRWCHMDAKTLSREALGRFMYTSPRLVLCPSSVQNHWVYVILSVNLIETAVNSRER